MQLNLHLITEHTPYSFFKHVNSIILLASRENGVKSRENGLAVQGIELCWLEGMPRSRGNAVGAHAARESESENLRHQCVITRKSHLQP